MASFKYDGIPSVSQFRKDSSVNLAIRGRDEILTHLDWLLERFHADHGPNIFRKHVIACDLFLTANYWIRSFHEKNPRLEKERYPAVLALFASVVDTLALMLGCSGKRLSDGSETMWGEVQVKNKMVEIFGKDIIPEKAKSDADDQVKHYNQLELRLHRIWFRDGRAFKYSCDKDNILRLMPANSREYYRHATRPGAGEGIPNWAPFVMTYERVFYMSRHDQGIFHSAYTAGQPVSCAGTMLIENGVVKGIRPDSGHYQPLDQNAVAALTGLMMFGVDLSRVKVIDWSDSKGSKAMKSAKFLNANLTWAKYTKSESRPIADTPYG
jgi:hypothetical protein